MAASVKKRDDAGALALSATSLKGTTFTIHQAGSFSVHHNLGGELYLEERTKPER